MIYKLLTYSVRCNKTLPYIRQYAMSRNPLEKTLNVLSNDIPIIRDNQNKGSVAYPEHADIVIIGGGFIGSAVAYWLKSRAGVGLSVVVLEKDFTYKGAQRNLFLGTLTQHFSLPENIQLSQHAAHFMRNIKENISKDLDIKYFPTGSIVLASEQYAEKLEENVKLQNELGTRSIILTTKDINNKFPWINTDDVKLGSMAVESEGVFDSWAFLKGLVQKSKELDVDYVNAEVTGFEMELQRDMLMEGVAPGTYEKINKVIYKGTDNEEHTLKFAICILAAGDSSGEIAKKANIGVKEGLLKIPLAIEKREYNLYSIKEKTVETSIFTPLVTDTTGLWLMRNGLESNLLCGSLPLIKDDTKDVPEEEYMKNIIKPSLINRVPSFENAQICRFSGAMQDCNTFDNSGVLGPHPYHNNLYIATGFGKLGCQHAPGIGRAIAELVIDCKFTTLDLTRFGYDRLIVNDPIVEFNVY